MKTNNVPLDQPATMTLEEWKAEARRRFGDNPLDWKFTCPVCKYVQSVRECRDAGHPEGSIGFSCIGRSLPECRRAFEEKGKGPCNYAGGGLFRLNPILVDGNQVFAFAPPTKADNE